MKKLIVLLLLLLMLSACQDSAPPPARPAPPSDVRVEASNGEIRLRWQGSAGATGYNVYRSQNRSVEIRPANRRNATLVTATTFSDEGVTNGQTYYYVVTSVGLGGESAASQRVEAIPDQGLLAPPQNLTASPSEGEVSLSWEESEGATGYNVYRSETPGVEIKAANKRNPTPLTVTAFRDEEVATGRTYYYVVTAVDQSDESAASREVEARPRAGIPTAPTELNVDPGDGAVRLSWQVSAGATGYNVYRSETPGVERSAANRRNTAEVSTTSFIDTQLTTGRTYYYVVTAVGPGGESGASDEVMVDPGGDLPEAPTALMTHPGDGQVTLSWRPIPVSVRYNVYRGTSANVEVTGANRIGTVLTPNYVDNNVVNGTTYYYVVTAVATNGRESAASNEESARPEAGAALRPQVTGVQPADGMRNVQLNEFVSTDLYLPNGGFHEDTLTPGTVRLIRVRDGRQVPANLNYSGGRDTFTLQPAELLRPNTQYRFEVTQGLKDETGVSFVTFTSTFTTGNVSTIGDSDIKFEKIELPTSQGAHYTSLAIGPDGKLYAATIMGEIRRFSILPDGMLGEPEVIKSLTQVEGKPRLLIGLVFDPAATADNLVAWVTHTFLHDRSSNVQPNDWTSKITRLSGPNLENVEDYVVGLPRSTIDHATNIPAFGPDGALYVPQGSNTSMGAPDRPWGNRPERLLSAAVLRVDLRAIASGPRPLNVKTGEGGAYNPFAPGAPVTIYASGLRNTYHIVWHSNGQLYAPTNGPGAGGNTPGTPSSPSEACRTRRLDGFPYDGPEVPALTRVSEATPDFLFRLQKGGYYGHPNPERCEWVLNGGNPTSDEDPGQVNDYPVGTQPDRNWRGFAQEFNLHASSNGVIEYKNDAFGGQLRGKMLVVRFNAYNDILVLTPGGAGQNYRIVHTQVGIEGLMNFLTPLALVENTSNGHVYVAEFNRSISGFSLDDLAALSLEPMQQDTQPKITLLRPKP